MTTIGDNLIGTQPATVQPILSVSELASSRLLAMMREKGLEGYALRVFVSGGGCSGLQYGMTFDNETLEGDNEFSTGGLRVLVDRISAGYLMGASIDYVDSLMGGGFKIDNPNAVSSCGCGHSFRTASSGDAGASGGGCSSCG
ncbi:MAG: iron-sulfur cluster assembly accessory protein [Oscillochloridaceae bacterium]|nr:iron-sulfur cluster assembly accessory protein [Chloroflexaceae bacterium]MDW8389903.1 iron-sulfur cluster assembly accessory protein [Oscillochloridaceae bacterium]